MDADSELRGAALHTAQHPPSPASALRVGVVNAVATGQGRRHQDQHLVSGVGTARRTAQVNLAADQCTETKTMGQCDRKQQPGIGHQAVTIKGDLDGVRLLRW